MSPHAWLRKMAVLALGGAAFVSTLRSAAAQEGRIPPPRLLPPVGVMVADAAPLPASSIVPVAAVVPAETLPRVPAADTPARDDLNARIERLERQNQELLSTLKAMQQAPVAAPVPTNPIVPGGPAASFGALSSPLDRGSVQKIVTDYLGERDQKSKADEEAKKKEQQDKGFVVGQNLGLTASWTNYQPWLESADKAFRIHVGGRAQMDYIVANATDRVQTGKGGAGAFNDAINFRRARLEVDGWMYEVFDFFTEYDFIQTINDDPTLPANQANVTNIPAPTDVWGSINYIPWIGTLRAGNMKPSIGLDHLTSSRYLDFLERSAGFDTYFNRNNGFQPGVQMLNWTTNERATWQLGLFKANNTIQGWNVGDGEYQVNGRVTWLPYYQDNGRYMVHLGLGVQHDAPDDGVAILRNRWLLRNGPPSLHNTVAFAAVNGGNQNLVNPEFFMNVGPLSIQAEYLANWMDGVTAFTTQSQGAVNLGGAKKSYMSQTAYVQALYFLTGENRPYAKTGLHGSGAAPTRVVPYRNVFWVPGQNCGSCFSQGAWQVGARYCYSDLSNNGIFGGQVHEVTLGLNWFLNPNMKIQWNYDVGYRGDLGPASNSNGTYQGFGTRFALDF